MVRLFTQFQNALLQMEYSKKNKENKWHMFDSLYVYGNIIRIITDAILNDNLRISIFNKIYCKCLQRNHVHWASLIKSTDAKLKIFKMRYKLKTGNFWAGSTWLIILAKNVADYTWVKLLGLWRSWSNSSFLLLPNSRKIFPKISMQRKYYL